MNTSSPTPLRAADLRAAAAAAAQSAINTASFLSFQNGEETVARSPRRHIPPRAVTPPLLPFVCRVAVDSESGKPHLFCYVTLHYDTGIVSLMQGSRQIPLTTESEVVNGWIDCGEWSGVGSEAWLVPYVSRAEWDLYKEKAPIIGSLRYRIGRNSRDVPQDAVYTGALAPSVLLARQESAGLRQYFVGPYYMNHPQADGDVQKGSAFNSGWPRTLSVTGDQGAALALYGFQSPTVISNPFHLQNPPAVDPDAPLVLVRVKNQGGDEVSLQYVPLSYFTKPKDEEEGGEDEELDAMRRDYRARASLPCPVDGLGDFIFWDPCAQSWQSVRGETFNVLPLIEALKEYFWKIGGDAETCKGDAIGDASGSLAIRLTARELIGSWTLSDVTIHGYRIETDWGQITPADFTVDGATAGRFLTVNQSPPPDLASAGSVAALSSRVADLESANTALAARIAALEETLRGVAVQPLSFADGTTINVLAKQ